MWVKWAVRGAWCVVGAMIAGLLAIGCSSTSGDGSTCGAISGTYATTEQRDPSDPGSCSAAMMPSPTGALTITSSTTNGMTTYELGGNPACAVNVAGCILFASCQTTEGADATTVTYTLAFTADGFSGTNNETRTVDGTVCSFNIDITGTRQ